MIGKRTDIGVQYPVHLGAADPDHQRIQRIVLAAPRPEPVQYPKEIFLVDRVQHHGGRPLDDLVFQGSDIAGITHLIQLAFGKMVGDGPSW